MKPCVGFTTIHHQLFNTHTVIIVRRKRTNETEQYRIWAERVLPVRERTILFIHRRRDDDDDTVGFDSDTVMWDGE